VWYEAVDLQAIGSDCVPRGCLVFRADYAEKTEHESRFGSRRHAPKCFKERTGIPLRIAK
jgi:hypothetical protein